MLFNVNLKQGACFRGYQGQTFQLGWDQDCFSFFNRFDFSLSLGDPGSPLHTHIDHKGINHIEVLLHRLVQLDYAGGKEG